MVRRAAGGGPGWRCAQVQAIQGFRLGSHTSRLQVGIGASAGRLAAEWVGRRAEGGAPGWHARKGSAAARTMALTTAAAAGVPTAAGALLARPPPAQAGAESRP